MIKSNMARVAIGAILSIYIISLAVMLCLSSPGLNWDPAFTLKLAYNSYQNIPFNYFSHPAPSNLQHNQTEFVSWWTPGQYALPMLIGRLFTVNLNIAIKILTAVCMLISAIGILKLFRKLIDADGPISGTTLVVFVVALCNPIFFNNVFLYDGGGILMLTYCPWFIYLCLKIKRLSAANLLILLLAGFTGFFLKAAFTGFFAAGLLYVFITQSSILPYKSLKTIDIKKAAKTALLLGLVFVVYFLTVKLLFLNHSRNIADSSMGMRLQPRVIVYPVIGPFLGLFRSEWLNTTALWLMVCAFVLPVYYLILKSPAIKQPHKYVIGSFFGVSIAFYALIYFLNLDVSYESRHFAVLSILILPALFTIGLQKQTQLLFTCGVVLYTLFNLYQYTDFAMAALKQNGTAGYYSGLLLPHPDDLLKKIHELDIANPAGNDIFYIKNNDPTLTLEIRKNRVLLEDNYANFGFDNSQRFKAVLYHGYNTGQIYVIYPDENFKTDSAQFLTKFERYKRFQKIYQSKGYRIFKAIPSSK